MTATGLAASALMVAAMVVGSAMIIVGASLVALATAVVSPLAGLIALAFTAPLPRPLVIPAPGIFAVMIGAILLGVVLQLPVLRPRLRRPSSQVLLLGAFLAWVSAHFVGGLLDGHSGSRSGDIASLYATTATGVLSFIAASAVLRDRSPYPVLAALLLSAALASGIVFAQLVGAEGIFGELVGPSAFPDRQTGPFGDPNYAGAYYAVATTLAVACAVIAKSPRLKVLILGLAGFVSAALMLTESRGGLVALAAGLTTIAITRGRRALLLAITAMLVLVATAYPMFAEMRFGPDSSIAGGGLSAQLDNSDRIGPWLAGGEVFLSAPLFGVGWGRLVEESSIGIMAHNWYIAVLAETGIVGFVLWALFIVSVVTALWRSPPAARTVGYSVLIVWMTASMFVETPHAFSVTGPVLIALAAAIWANWTPVGHKGLP